MNFPHHCMGALPPDPCATDEKLRYDYLHYLIDVSVTT